MDISSYNVDSMPVGLMQGTFIQPVCCGLIVRMMRASKALLQRVGYL